MSKRADDEKGKVASDAKRPLWGGLPHLAASIARRRPPPDEFATARDGDPEVLARARARAKVEAEAELDPSAGSDERSCDSEVILDVRTLIGQRYVIEEHISSGGFGAVYRASDREIRHHQVALKLLHRRSASEEERQAALRELRLIATVTHPSVVQFKEYGWHEGRLWFAMPWYRGQTLDLLLSEGKSASAMSRADARVLFTRIAHGLAAMHAMGVHHHDIKPENIFVAQIAGFPGGLPVLLDLGIATQRGENPTGLTVEYAAPETAAVMVGKATQPIGGAADVYSLALVLRNALDPQMSKPVHASEVLPLLRQRATGPTALSKKRELSYMRPHFRRWLSHDPSERPTAAELADELAILTAPEDRRRAQLRFVRRTMPMLILAGVMITGLVFQLRQHKTALVVQSRELAQQRQVGEALRRQSDIQLDQLDLNARKLGDERRQLQHALAFARKLSGQIGDAAKRYDELDRQHMATTAERNDLSRESLGLTAERDGLLADLQALTEERATLVAERDNLSAEKAKVTSELADTAREREKLVSERDRLTGERDKLVIEKQRLTDGRDRAVAETDALTNRVDLLAKERDGLTAQAQALDKRVDELTKERDKLERQVAAMDDTQGEAARKRDGALSDTRKLEQQLATEQAARAQLERRVREMEAKPAPHRPASTNRARTKPRARKRARRR